MPRNRPTLRERREDYINRIEDGLALRHEREKDWDVTDRLYRSELVTRYHSDETIHVNLLYAYVESVLPSLVFNNPEFSATPLTEEAFKSRKTTEAVVAAELRANMLRQRIKRSAFDMLLKGVGILQAGFFSGGLLPEAEIRQQSSDDLVDQLASQINQGEQTPGQGQQPLLPTNPTPATPTRKTKQSDIPYGLRPSKFYVQDIRPMNFVNDPGAVNADFSDSTWCAVRYIRRLADIKRDRQYKNTDNLQKTSSNIPDQYSNKEHYNAANPIRGTRDIDMVDIWQLWDIVEREIWTIVLQHDMFLRKDQWDLPSRRFPFYAMKGTEDNSSFWCQAPVWPWVNLVDEMNLVYSGRLAHINRMVRKYVTRKGAIEDEDLQKLITPEDGLVIEVEATGVPLKDVIVPIDDAPITGDNWRFMDEMWDRFQWISGVSNLDMGGMRAGERPAAEINRLAAGANIRRNILGQRVVEPLELLAYDATTIIRKYYSHEDVIQITDDKGAATWLRFQGRDVSTEYLWRVSIEDMAPITKSGRLQQELQKLQIFAPFGQGGLNIVDLVPLLMKVAEEVGIDDLQLLPQAQVAPMDPGTEWVEMREKSRQIRPHPADDHELHLLTHNMQVIVEQQRPDTKPAALQWLFNHIEEHKGIMQAQKMTILGLQQKQGGQNAGGAPGPAPGVSNNLSGLGGIFAGGQAANPLQDLLGQQGGPLQ